MLKKYMFIFIMLLTFTWTMADKLPDFKLTSLENKPVSISSLIKENDYTLVSFFETWCPYCREELKDFVILKKKYGYQKIGHLAVAFDSNPDLVVRLIKQLGINFPVIRGSDEIRAYLSIRAYPVTLVLDKNQNIIQNNLGYYPLDYYENLIKELKKEGKGEK
ncbi:MAG: TlpA disulfide reductase family protein [Candidatus Margulisbacteria bacterium]|nr:TlpA disulfide reductase family protein [Candidatus Margulisiibacteriota bacterium]